MSKMMKYTPIFVILIVLGLLAFSSKVHAEPPQVGELAQFHVPVIICDEVEQVIDTYTDQGIHSNAWAINLITPVGNVWIIYIERIQETSL